MVFQRFRYRHSLFSRGFMRLQEAFKTVQNASKTTPRRFKPPRGSSNQLQQHQNQHRYQQQLQDGSKTSPRCLQDAPRGLQDASKSGQGPKKQGTPMVFQRFQCRHSSFSRGSMRLQEGSKTPPRRLQDASSHQEALRGCKT